MANQLIFALPRVTDSNGDPASGALAYFYQTGTTSPITVHTDAGLSVAHASPVVADSGGAFAQVFYGGATDVKVVVKTSAGVTLYQYDPCPMITGVSSDAEGISFSPITGNAAANVQSAIEINTLAISGLIPETRSISAGAGLVGGGDLSSNRTFAIDEGDAAALTAGTNGKFPDCQTIDAWVRGYVDGFTSTEQTITSAALLTLPHGLGAAPSRISLQLSCQTDEHNWVAGDKPFITGAQSSGATARHNSVWADATNVYVRFSDIATCFVLGNKTTGVAANLTNANWRLLNKAGL